MTKVSKQFHAIPKSGTTRESLRITIPVNLARKYKLKVGQFLSFEDLGNGIKIAPVTKQLLRKICINNIKGGKKGIVGGGSSGAAGDCCGSAVTA